MISVNLMTFVWHG